MNSFSVWKCASPIDGEGCFFSPFSACYMLKNDIFSEYKSEMLHHCILSSSVKWAITSETLLLPMMEHSRTTWMSKMFCK